MNPTKQKLQQRRRAAEAAAASTEATKQRRASTLNIGQDNVALATAVRFGITQMAQPNKRI